MRSSTAKMGGSNSRKRPYGLLLLLALGMAILCAVALHQLRESRVLGLLLLEREQQILTLQILLQKERGNSKEMKRKIDDAKAKAFALRSQKMELFDKLTETRNTLAQLKKLRSEMEAALVEKQVQVDKLTDKTEELMITNLKVGNLTSLLKQKEAEVEETKRSPKFSEERKEELAMFRTYRDEVGMKDENVSRRNQQEAEKKLTNAEENQTLGIKELNVIEAGKGDTKTAEETDIQMKENDRIEEVYHANLEEINEQLKSPKGSELAAKNQSENAGAGKDDKMIGSSSGQTQYKLTEKTPAVDHRTTYSESSNRNISRTKNETEGIEQVRKNMKDGNREAKSNKSKKNQREKEHEKSKAEEQSSSSKDLQLQETTSSVVSQSSQENENGFTETTQKEAGKEAKSIGLSEIKGNVEESETKKQDRSEKDESLEDKQNI